MAAPLWFTLLALWSCWLLQALISALQVARMRNRVDWTPLPADPINAFRPPTTVILPVKGVDLELPQCIDALCQLDYPSYRIVAVVESEDDPAYPVLRERFSKQSNIETRIVIAGLAGPNVSQKVHNQLQVIAELEAEELGPEKLEAENRAETAGGSDGKWGEGESVWAFADSDIVPDPDWLATLVGRLFDPERTAVSTGYRWMVPRDNNPTIAARFMSIINSSAACHYRLARAEVAWGGSMAIRVDTARELDLVGWLTNTLSDDLQVSQMCRAHGKRVRFVPQCLVTTPIEHTTWGTLFEFGKRQYTITRAYRRLLYSYALIVNWTYVIAATSAMAALVIEWFAWQRGDSQWWRWSTPLAVMAIVHGLNHLRSSARAQLIERRFGTEVRAAMRSTLRLDRWATLGWMTCNALMLASAMFSKTVRWRTNRYRIDGPQDVKKL